MKRLWAGRILSAFVILFLLFDAIVKVLKMGVAVAPTVQLGYPESLVRGIGILELVCLVLYAIPATSFLSASLLTGYLGGAVATHLRVGNPLFTFTLFPVYVGMMIWGALYLRDGRLRALFVS
jgi:hypothetical protein